MQFTHYSVVCARVYYARAAIHANHWDIFQEDYRLCYFLDCNLNGIAFKDILVYLFFRYLKTYYICVLLSSYTTVFLYVESERDKDNKL